MKESKKVVLITIFSILLFLESLMASNIIQIEVIELELRFSFPASELVEEDIYLFQGQRFSSDRDGNIFVACLGDHQILKFSSRGDFISRIGREGQGPNQAVTWDNRLFVLDNFSRNIQILDNTGQYINSFIAKSCWDIVISDSGLLCTAPLVIQRGEKLSLIEVYNQEGEIKYSFGEPIDLKQSFTMGNRVKLANYNKDEIIIAFTHWPIIRRYSLAGELKAEYTIDHKMMKENAAFNQLQQKKPRKIGGPSRSKSVIDDIEVLGGSVYILFSSNPDFKVEILELNIDMKVINTYSIKPSERHHYGDLLIRKQDGELLFYNLQMFPENKVDVFGIKKN